MSENPGEEMVQTLFGDWVYARPRKRGRPPFERTEENANKVMMLSAMDWEPARIATCILDPRTGKAICLKTLERYFSPELKEAKSARDRLRARQLMEAADAAFNQKNVGAMRLFETLVQRNDVIEAAARVNQPDKVGAEGDTDGAPEKLGKKEIAQREAERVASGETDGWGDDLKPGGYH